MTEFEKIKNYVEQNNSMLIVLFDGRPITKTTGFRAELIQKDSDNHILNLYADTDRWFFSLDERYLLDNNKAEKELLEKENENDPEDIKYYHYDTGINHMGKPYLHFYTLTRKQYKKAIEIFQS